MPRRPKMSAPVTHEQLQAEIAPIRERLDRTVTKDELYAAVGALRSDIHAVIREMRTMRIELTTDLTRHVVAMTDDLRGETRAVDERYADLPDRVATLEKNR